MSSGTRLRTSMTVRWMPYGACLSAEGVVEGVITVGPRGVGGFGYDPVFAPVEAGGLTFAEMGPTAKNAMSHRARALRALLELLRA